MVEIRHITKVLLAVPRYVSGYVDRRWSDSKKISQILSGYDSDTGRVSRVRCLPERHTYMGLRE